MPDYKIDLPGGESYTISSPTELDDNHLGALVNDARSRASMTAPKPKKGKQYDSWKELASFAEGQGFTVTGKNETSGHNTNSPHYEGRAIDVRVRDKSALDVQEFIGRAKAAGYRVRDERTRPPGQAVWSGPHIHLDVPPGWKGAPKVINFGNSSIDGVMTREEYNKKKLAERIQSSPNPHQLLQNTKLPVDPLEQLRQSLNPFQFPKPQQQTFPVPPKSIVSEIFKPVTRESLQADIARSDALRRGKTVVQYRAEVPGTIEYSMDRVRAVIPKLTRFQKDTIQQFLLNVGGDNIQPEQIHAALRLAGEGKWAWMRKPQEAVDKLPFTLGELSTAYQAHQRGEQNVYVNLRNDKRLPFHIAMKRTAKAFDVPYDELDGKIIAAFAKGSAYEESLLPKGDRLDTMTKTWANAVPDDTLGIYLSSPKAAFETFIPTAIDYIGLITGHEQGELLDDPAVMNHPAIKFLTAATPIAKYFTPAGPYAAVGDIMGIAGHATDVGIPQAAADTLTGIAESAKFWDPKIDGYERAARVVNFALLGLGLTHGGIKAWQAGNRWAAAKELSTKLNISRTKAYNLIAKSEKQAKAYIAQQERIMKNGTGPDIVPFLEHVDSLKTRPTPIPKVNHAQPSVPIQEPAPAQPLPDEHSFKNKMQRAFNLTDEEAHAVAALADARATAWSRSTGQPKEDWLATRIQDIVRGGESVPEALAQQALAESPNSTVRTPKDSVEFVNDGKAIIRAFEHSDVSTAVHELSHVFRRDLEGRDKTIVEDWAGVKDFEWKAQHEEKFARAFERYLRDGSAPTKKLAEVFARFKDWLTSIYSRITGTELDVKISPEVRGTFDRLLGKEMSPNQVIEVNGQRLKVKLTPQMMMDWDNAKLKYENDIQSLQESYKAGQVSGNDKVLLEKKLQRELKQTQRNLAGYYTPEEAMQFAKNQGELNQGDSVMVKVGRNKLEGTVQTPGYGEVNLVRVKTIDGKIRTVGKDAVTKVQPETIQAELISHEGQIKNPQEPVTTRGKVKQGGYPEQGRLLTGAEAEANHPSNFKNAQPADPQPPKPVQQNQPLQRNWKAGNDVNASIVFDSTLQKDLYDVGAILRESHKNTGSASHGQKITERVQKVVDRYGLSEGEVRNLGGQVHSDVLEQMKGIKDGELRKVIDNVEKPKVKPSTSQPVTTPSKTSNKVFTDEAKEAALKRIKERTGRANFLVDPGVYGDWAIVAGHFIEKGVRSFGEFSKQMIAELGSSVQDHLPTLFNKAHDELGLSPGEKVSPTRVSKGTRAIEAKDFNFTHVVGKTPVLEMVDELGKSVYVTENGKIITPNNNLKTLDSVLPQSQFELGQKYAQMSEEIAELRKNGDVQNSKRIEARRKDIELKLNDEIAKTFPSSSQPLRDKVVNDIIVAHLNDSTSIMQYVKEKAGYLTEKQEVHIQSLANQVEDLTKEATAKLALLQDRLNTRSISQEQFQTQFLKLGQELLTARRQVGEQIVRFIVDKQKDSILDTVTSFWKASMLFTVRNPIMNLKSNLLDSLGQSLSRIPRGLVDAGLGRLTGIRTREINLQSPLKGIRNMVSNETFEMMKGSITGKLTSTDLGKLDLPHRSNSQMFAFVHGPGHPGDLLMNKVIDTVFGAVQAYDKPFMQLAFKRSIEEQARLIARKVEHLSGKAQEDRVKELTENPTDAMKLVAYEDAEYATLASKNSLAEAIQSGKLKLKNSESVGGQALYHLSNFVAPFLKIPLNAAAKGIEFAGGGVVQGTYRLGDYVFKSMKTNKPAFTFKEALKKTFEDMPVELQRQIADNIGNGVTGLGLIYLGSLMYQKGLIRPFRPNTEEQRNRNEALGQQNGSVAILGHDIDISDSFVGRMLATGATYQAYQDGQFVDATGEKQFGQTIGAGFAGVTRNPISDATNTVDQFIQNPIQTGGRWLKSQIASLHVPGFVSELSKATSDITPVTEKGLAGVLDTDKSRLPFVKGSMQPKTDALGKVVRRSWLEYVTGTTENTDNPVATELDRLHINISKPQLSKKNSLKYGEDKRYDRSQADYEDRVAFVGMRVQQALKDVVKDPEYLKMNDFNRKAMLKEMLAGVKKGANEELDAMRTTEGWDKVHKHVQELLKKA